MPNCKRTGTAPTVVLKCSSVIPSLGKPSLSVWCKVLSSLILWDPRQNSVSVQITHTRPLSVCKQWSVSSLKVGTVPWSSWYAQEAAWCLVFLWAVYYLLNTDWMKYVEAMCTSKDCFYTFKTYRSNPDFPKHLRSQLQFHRPHGRLLH